ncbi:GNAT family N-acetyltransferase (plasmid) [Rhizobium sp. CB3090]|uniref:GNAT family N-acetyltransferase n=1 Tax=Rhizobium sp. CB3090 TaxID=3039156 RepID=UPI0024B2383A|nr:GNAT family N-acetyltransferase [Rhizobium sp. CB3090]WFU13090.1 GNAT family N-acetyltransferase [Rhizobium sp. CB3090]
MAEKQAHIQAPIVIEYLENWRDLFPVCASWSFGQWGCQANGSFEETQREFQASSRSSLPLTLVALEDRRPAGMISLSNYDFKGRPDLSPWLKSLYVHPFHRNKGTASLLVKRLEQEALRLGYERLYLTTESAKLLYAKNGWSEMDHVQTPYGDATLMTKMLLGARTV